MGFFMRSQAEIDREKHVKRAFDLSSRAMSTDSAGEREACESLLQKHVEKHQITDKEVLDYARRNQQGGKKQRNQQGGTSRPNYEQGAYYSETRDRNSRAYSNWMDEEYKKNAQRNKERGDFEKQKHNWKDEVRKQATAEWNTQFSQRQPNERWRPNRNGVAADKTTGEKIIGFIDSFFGL